MSSTTTTKRKSWGAGLALAAALLAVVGCDQEQYVRAVPLSEEEANALHASVVANAHAALAESVEDLSLAPPPMDATAEPETTGGGVAERVSTELEETDPAAAARKLPGSDDRGMGTGGADQKAKGAPRETTPPSGPTEIPPPRSAAEAAERDHEHGAPAPTNGPTPATPPSRNGTQVPSPASPTAPAETAKP